MAWLLPTSSCHDHRVEHGAWSCPRRGSGTSLQVCGMSLLALLLGTLASITKILDWCGINPRRRTKSAQRQLFLPTSDNYSSPSVEGSPAPFARGLLRFSAASVR